jgi:hypothetical protein
MLRLAVDQHVQAGDSAVPHNDLATECMGDDSEVLPGPDRFQVRGRGALPTGVLLGHVIPAHAFLDCAVEVGNEGNPQFLGRTYERLAQWIVLDLLGDVHRPLAAVVSVVQPLIRLGTPEKRQHLLKPPVLVAQLRPGLIVLFLAADVDHRVDRSAAAQRAALRIPHLPVVQLGLRDGGELPVVARAAELGESNRHVDQRGPVLATSFEQQHGGVGVGR